MPETDRAEPFLTIKTMRFSLNGRGALLGVKCPELELGMGVVANNGGRTRLIEDFMYDVNRVVAKHIANDYLELREDPEYADLIRRIHEATCQGIPLKKLFGRP